VDINAESNADMTAASKSHNSVVSDGSGPPMVTDASAVSADDTCDIMQESFPDVGLLDVDDESLPSGPSTNADNTVIYCGADMHLTTAVESVRANELELAASDDIRTDTARTLDELSRDPLTDIAADVEPDVLQVCISCFMSIYTVSQKNENISIFCSALTNLDIFW